MDKFQKVSNMYKIIFDHDLNQIDNDGYPNHHFYNMVKIWDYIHSLSDLEIKVMMGEEVQKTIEQSTCRTATINIHNCEKQSISRIFIPVPTIIQFCKQFDHKQPMVVGSIQPNTDLWIEVGTKLFLFNDAWIDNEFEFFLIVLIKKMHGKL